MAAILPSLLVVLQGERYNGRSFPVPPPMTLFDITIIHVIS
jgi:hypothetical protein